MKMYRPVTLLVLFVGIITSAYSNRDHSLFFVENKGQWEQNIKFRGEIKGGFVWLENKGFSFVFYNQEDIAEVHHAHHKNIANQSVDIRAHAYRCYFQNTNQSVSTISQKSSDTYHNYFLGNNPSRWASGVNLFEEVIYNNLYDGINAKVYSVNGNFKYDFIIEKGSNPDNIKWKYDGVLPELTDGMIKLKTEAGDVFESRPYAYQEINGKKHEVKCMYKLTNGIVSFEFPEGYNISYNLIIDPTLIFSSYTGSSADNWGFTATYDKNGSLYAGGIVFGSGYPTTSGAYKTTFSGESTDIGISKFSPTGNTLLFSTYLGGSNVEAPHSMIVDSKNNLLVMGTTSSNNFPTTVGCYDNSFNGGTSVSTSGSVTYSNGSDIIVTKFNFSGTALLSSTYIGGTGNDGLNTATTLNFNYADHSRGEIVVDLSDDVYVCSSTYSNNFPTTAGSYSQTPKGGQDGCVFRLDSSLSTLKWSSYLGGTGNDASYSLKVASNGNVYITGGTLSNNFPTTAGVIQPALGGGADGYISSLNSNNGALVAGSYMGGGSLSGYDQSFLVELDDNNNVYVVGQTKSNFPSVTPGSYSNANSAQFIYKMNPTLTGTIFSTVFGSGSKTAVNISPTALLVDNCENIYVSGWGGSTNNEGSTSGMPVTGDAYKSTTDGSDFYFIVLSKNASSLLYGSYFGSNSLAEHVDGGTSRFDKNGTIYQAVCAGCGGSSGFPTTPGVWSTTNNSSNCNLAAIKMAFDYNGVDASASASPNVLACDPPFDVTFQGTTGVPNHYWDFGDGTGSSTQANPTYTFQDTGNFVVTYIAIDSSTCNISDTIYLSVQILQSETFSATLDVAPYDPCSDTIYDVTLEFTGSGADSLIWNMGDGAIYTNDTIVNHTYSAAGTYIIKLIAYDYTCGRTDSILDTVSFMSNSIIADAQASPNVLACDPPFDVNFQGSSGAPNHYWDFGDGTGSSTQANPTYTFQDTGNYTVTYVVIDSASCNISDTTYLTVQILQSETFSATLYVAPYDPCSDTIYDVTLEFTGSGADSLIWNMGDGAIYTNDTIVNHTYSAAGTYIIKLIAYDYTCGRTDSIIDTVSFMSNSIIADAQASPNVLACDPPFDVNFQGSSGAPNHYWDFGDGTGSSTQANPTYTFQDTGNYTVTYVVIDSASCNISDTTYLTVQILQSEAFSADIDIPLYDPCTADSLTINLIFTGTGADSLVWNMGDGSIYYDSSFTHTYTSYGTYVITLTAYDFTCNKTGVVTDTVRYAGNEIFANANASPNIIACDPPFIVNFISGNSTPNHYWSFGDGSGTSSLSNPTYTFQDTGNYTITYVAIDSSTCNIADTVFLNVQILQSKNFSAEFNSIPPQPCSDTVVVDLQFTGTGADSLIWDMGNGTTFINDTNLLYHYTEPGNYTLTLTAYDFVCGKTQTISQQIVVEEGVTHGKIEVPNVFTPNNDNVNDNFFVYYSDFPGIDPFFEMEVYEIDIFNRWGQLVFSSERDGDKKWDGRISGRIAAEGVYYYVLKYKRKCWDDQVEVLKGYVTLIR